MSNDPASNHKKKITPVIIAPKISLSRIKKNIQKAYYNWVRILIFRKQTLNIQEITRKGDEK